MRISRLRTTTPAPGRLHNMMTILLNGRQHECAPNLALSSLLSQSGYASGKIAVEINGEIVPRSQHPHYQLKPDDRVEIVHAIGGG